MFVPRGGYCLSPQRQHFSIAINKRLLEEVMILSLLPVPYEQGRLLPLATAPAPATTRH